MLLSARLLKDVSNVNSFEYADVAEFTKGDALSVYFQLIDSSVHTTICGYNPSGRRYSPASGATMSVTIENIDDAKKVTRTATQPFALDPSIWKVDILATDVIAGTANLRITLTEGAVITRGLVKSAFRIWPQSNI